MALTNVDHFFDTTKDDRPNLPPAPPVAITPADVWPRPYYLENGLRRVAPYHYTYNTFCKQRWRDREILDIFAAEFRDRSEEYYKDAIEDGRIVLNGKPCTDIHTRVKNGDVISHTLHRHEPPVSAQEIRVIHETDNMIVIDKPAGIPVHPAGRYKYNSIVEIMRAERHKLFNPLPCNRLDRLTSGVMFIAKNGKEAEAISAKLRGRTVRKEYVARVKGYFLDGERDQYTEDGRQGKGGIVKCEEPILQISPILGLNRARASGKSAKTLFRRIAFYPPIIEATNDNNEQDTPVKSKAAATENEGYSIVHCLPLTGRTHQIRVHLQFLGHPISNDPIYSNRRVFGPSLAKGDASDEHDEAVKARLAKMGKTEVADTYAYNTDKQATNGNILNTEIDLTGLNISETQQTTPKMLEMLRARELHKKYGPTADYKPLHHGTLQAGSLPTQSEEDNAVYTDMVKQHDEMVQDYNVRKGEKLTGEICDICQTPLYFDPGPQELGIYLHALAYADVHGEWRHTSPMPEWTRAPEDTNSDVMPPPSWDYEALGAEAEINLDGEEDKANKRNRKAMLENREMEPDT